MHHVWGLWVEGLTDDRGPMLAQWRESGVQDMPHVMCCPPRHLSIAVDACECMTKGRAALHV